MPLRPTALFYLGFFPIVLLLWAWADSLRFSTSWNRYLSGERRSFVMISNSSLAFGSNRPKSTGISMTPLTPAHGEIRRYTRQGLDSRLFPPLTEPPDYSTPSPYFSEPRVHRFPLWLILAAYLPLWLGLSYWRSSRIKKRIQQSLPPAQPQTDLDLRV